MAKIKFPLLFISLCLLFSFCFIPASATEQSYDMQKINVLDYGYPNNGSNNYINLSSSNDFTATWNLPFNYPIIFVDFIIEPAAAISTVGIKGSSGTINYLTPKSLENGLYRCTGQLNQYFGSSSIGITVTNSTGARMGCSFHRFDIYTYTNQGVPDIGEIKGMPLDPGFTNNRWYAQSAAGQPFDIWFYTASIPQTLVPYDVWFSSVNWRNYDYLDFNITVNAADIKYIDCYIESGSTNPIRKYLSFDLHYTNGTGLDKNEYIGSGSSGISLPENDWTLTLRVYIPRTDVLSGSLNIHVGGDYGAQTSRALINSVVGYYYLHVPSVSNVKMDLMIQAIIDSLSSSPDQDGAAGDFNNNMSDTSSAIAGNQEILNNVDKPSSADLGMMVSPSTVLDGGGISHVVNMISPITTSDLSLSIMALVASLALVSYILFGKKR